MFRDITLKGIISAGWHCWFLQELQPHEDILTQVAACVAEDGSVKDTASEEVRRTRGQLSSIEGRLNSILKGYGGEATEHVGGLQSLETMCMALRRAIEDQHAWWPAQTSTRRGTDQPSCFA